MRLTKKRISNVGFFLPLETIVRLQLIGSEEKKQDDDKKIH